MNREDDPSEQDAPSPIPRWPSEPHLEPALRQRAEQIAGETATPSLEDVEVLSVEEIRRALHDLRVHQIELTMQNEELRRVQIELGISQARYFDLYDLAPVGYCTLSEKGLVLEANLTAATLLGMPRGALIKQPLSRFILNEDQDLYFRFRTRLYEADAVRREGAVQSNAGPADEVRTVELRMEKPDGAPFWARLEATAAQDADGSPVGRVVMTDISARVRAEERLKESETRFRLLFERAPLSYQSLDENGHFIVVNQTWLDTLGYCREEVIGASFSDFLHPDWKEHFKENFPRFKATGEVLGVEFVMRKKDGTSILVSFNGKIGKDYSGRFQQTHCILQDITEFRRAEEALRRHQAMLARTEGIVHVGSWEWGGGDRHRDLVGRDVSSLSAQPGRGRALLCRTL